MPLSTCRYTGEGMDEMEFTEAESNMNDLVSMHSERILGACGSNLKYVFNPQLGCLCAMHLEFYGAALIALHKEHAF